MRDKAQISPWWRSGIAFGPHEVRAALSMTGQSQGADDPRLDGEAT